MDDLQYGCLAVISYGMFFGVLNLVINGWPSILKMMMNFINTLEF